ncbi:cysteine hydrolase [Ideonella livida]|uniref:Cysteine hydrolase n=1 Tax=Ideonella livida TaxID=2707176 RepID=A0A7C9TLW7_9BURK|nr:cysteine hydrolase [Ideonella livida]NDY93478.1 cysteine hydrolase [Ideonella livida]
MPARLELLLIDPQNDFCDLPPAACPADPLRPGARLQPALPVPGAHADLLRVAALVQALGPRLQGITLTLDSHHAYDIAHPLFWCGGDGSAVPPFTPITAAQVRAGQWRPRQPAALPRVLDYLDALEAAGRYTLMVWPLHAEVGSWGQGVHAAVQQACRSWQALAQRPLRTVAKGQNPWTEHYSALQAEVPDPADPGTALQRELIAALDQADLLLVAGQASSHCVRATCEHLAEHLPSQRLDKLVLLTDGMSPVPGFEPQAAAFLAGLQARGARLATTAQVLRKLLG